MTPETKVKQAIKEYLRHRAFSFPILQGRGSYRGVPDRFAIKNGVCYAIEIKAPNKGRQTSYQKEFQHQWEEAGGVYILATSIDDLYALR